MNSETNIESLKTLILNNFSVQLIIDQSLILHTIYSKEKTSSDYETRSYCIGKPLTECLNLDIVKRIVESIQDVQKKPIPSHFEINLKTRAGSLKIYTEVMQLPDNYFLITLEPQPREKTVLSDSLEKQVISGIIEAESIDQVIKIILEGMSQYSNVLGGGIYVYQYFPGEVSHQVCTNSLKNTLDEIHQQLKDSSFWVSISNGHTVFLPILEIKQNFKITDTIEDIKSILFLPIYSNNDLLGIIILPTKFIKFPDGELDLLEYDYSWFVQVLTSSIHFRKLKSEYTNYLNILNESQGFCFVVSPKGKIIFSNSSFRSKVKYSNVEISQLHLSDIVPDIKNELEGLIKSGTEINQDWHPLVYVDKYNNQFTLVTKLIFSDDGVMTAIAQREKTEVPGLDVISDKGIQLAANLSQPILLIDESTLSIRYANLFADQFFGFEEGELNNKNFLELISDGDHQFLFNTIRDKGYFSFDGDREWELKTKEKTKMQSRLISTNLDFEGKGSILLVVHQIEQEKIPALINDVSGFYNLLNQDLAILRLSPDGIITHANERFSELIGKPLEKMIGKSFEENLFIEDYESIFNHFSKLTPQVPIRKNTNRIVDANGRTIWVEWTDRGIFDGEELLEIYAIGKDITQEMQKDLIDQSGEQRYQALIETLPMVIYAFHIDTHFPLYVSPQIKSMTGYNAEEFYKNPDFWLTIMHADDAKDFYNKTIERMDSNNNEPIEFQVNHKDGRVLWLEEIGTTITLDDGTRIFQGAVRDITESHEIKEKLGYFSKIRGVIIEASIELLHANRENYSEIIQKTIAAIGNSLQVDRVIVFEKDKPGTSSSTSYEWCNEGISSQKERLQSVSHSTYPWWREKMENNNEIILDSINDLPKEAKAERENVIAQEIKSLIAMPLYSRGKISGWMGFDMVREEVHWEKEIISLLRLLSAMIVNTHERIFPE